MEFADAGGRCLLAIMPHPDDEAYTAAGLLSAAVASGADVALATATRGERGWARDGFQLGGRSLAEARREELTAACAEMGVSGLQILDWPDGGISEMDDDECVEGIAELLTARAAQVVVTLAGDGIYGHRDHCALTRHVLAAAAPEVRVLGADFPRGTFSGFARRFARFAPHLLVPQDPDALGCEEADLVLELGETGMAKRRAILAHDSQLLSVSPPEFLFPGLLALSCQREWYRVLSGPALPVGASSPFAALP